MKTCPLCNKPIETNQHVVAIMGARCVLDEADASKYTLETTRQAILSHFQCPLNEVQGEKSPC